MSFPAQQAPNAVFVPSARHFPFAMYVRSRTGIKLLYLHLWTSTTADVSSDHRRFILNTLQLIMLVQKESSYSATISPVSYLGRYRN